MFFRSMAAGALALALGSVLAPGCTVDDEPRPTLPALPVSTNSGTCYEPPGCQVQPNSKCLAKIDNSKSDRKTLRLSQLRVLAPAKLSTKLVQNTIVSPAVTQLDPPCLLKDVNKGGLFNWLVDFDTKSKTLRTGCARAIEDLSTGYCFLKADYGSIHVEPITADIDFDPAKGTFATKAPIAQLAIPIFQKRDPNDIPILLPLRNAEILDGTLSSDGNCIGRYRGETGELDANCDTTSSDVSDPASYRFENGGKIQGVITLEEADQVKIVDLKQTLCTLLTGKFAADKVDGYQVCSREGGALSAEVMASADASSTPDGPKDAVKLAAEFAASAIKILDGECNLNVGGRFSRGPGLLGPEADVYRFVQGFGLLFPGGECSMANWTRRAFYASMLAVVACSGGGGGCSSCSGVTPLPQGFPVADRVENVATVRLTKAGLGFMNDNLSALVGQFGGDLLKDGVFVQAIPSSETALGPIKAKICPDGSDPTGKPHRCIIEADIKSSTDPSYAKRLKLAPAAPNLLKLSGNLKTKAELINIKVPLGTIPIVGTEVAPPIQVSIGDGQNGDCSTSNFTEVPIEVDIQISTDTNQAHGTRAGLSRVKISKFELNIPESDVHICGKCDVPVLCGIWDGIIGGVGGLAKGLLIDQLKGPLQSQIDQALCIKGNKDVSPPCPIGSHPKDPADAGSTCVFDDNSGDCASFALGTEGTINLGGALSSFSPTTTGGLDFLFGLGGLAPNPNNGGLPLGDLAPVNEGASLSLTGGANANPLSKCVNPAVLQKPTDIPTPKLLLGNDVPNWPADIAPPHFGLAISEDFANYAMGGIYNSGLLCLQIGTEQVAQLNSGALGTLIPSFKTLPLQKQNAPVGLVMKPTNPPVITFGSGADPAKDPTMKIDLKGLGIDFYVWSSDRYIRTFASSFDLGVPVTLAVSKEGLAPQIADLTISNMKVTNSELLSEAPAKIGAGLEGILSAAVGQALGGGIKPIDLSGALSSLGFTLNIPAGAEGKASPGIQKVTEGSKNFLGIFASLGIAAPAPAGQQQQQQKVAESKTSARLTDRRVEPAGLRVQTMTRDNAPVLVVSADSSLGEGAVEYSYQVDKGFWRPWTSEGALKVHDDVLRLQGKHVIHVKSRKVGQPMTEGEPVDVPVTLDVDPPQVRLRREGSALAVKAADQVADDEELRVRYAIDQQAFTDWVPYHDGIRIPTDKGAQVTVEVKDGEENVAQVSQALRGKIDTTGQASSGGCGCTVPGGEGQAPWPLGAFGVAGVIALLRGKRRRLREAVAGVTVLAVSGSWAGCSCSDDSETAEEVPLGQGGQAGSAGAGGKGPTENPCKPENDCVVLNPGIVGSYTSAATASDGTLWVSGYNEADVTEGYPYGDLVVGKYDAAKGVVAWKTVDGTNADEEVDPTAFDAQGWREGKSEPGDDVGLWTSIVVGEGDKPAVAYYDVTHGALKFASFDGEKWSSHAVQQKPKGQIGRYAKMQLVGGKPVIAFMFYEPGQGGFAASGVRVARAKSATPAAAGDWAFEDVYTNPQTPCRASLCDGSNKCNVASGKCEAPAAACDPKCGADQACFNGADGPACQTVASNGKAEAYLNATGLYVAAALNPAKTDIGVAFYDRLRGNVYAAQKKGAWEVKIAEGQAGPEPGTDTGDVGIGASLFIDDKGDWHLSYINGLDESLRYLLLPGGATTDGAKSEVVDYGGAPGSNEDSADKSLVGDDSSIRVADGKITIAYQNATGGKLRVASRPVGGGAWTKSEVKQDGKFAGFFSQQVTAGGGKKLVNFWRVGGAKVAGDVAVVDAP